MMSPRTRMLSRRTILGMPAAWLAVRTAPEALAALMFQVGSPDAGAAFVDAADFGLAGDGTTDDAAALQAAIDLAAERQVRLVIPPGTYGVATSIDLRSGSTMSAYGATLVTYIPGLGDPGTSQPTVRIYDAEDVSVHGLEIEGRKDAFAHSQWKHGFGLNNSRRVRLYQCHANRCKGDGVILENENVGDVNIDVLVESCTFGQNYRMGGTASGALRATFRNCTFWGTVGTEPMCGFDVEPDRPDVTCQDISFVECDFSDNGPVGSGQGYGFNVSFREDATGPQSGVYLERCTMSRNGAAGVDLYQAPRDVELSDCAVFDNAQDGIRIFADATDIVIRGGNVTTNGHHGIHCAAEPEAPCQGVEIDAVTIRGNGWLGATPGNGIHLDHIVRDVRVSACTISGSRGYGLYAAPTVSNLSVDTTAFEENLRGSTYPELELDAP